MKIGLVQINPVIGDFKKNCDKIQHWAGKAKKEGCELVIFPEMIVSGYPPQDLLDRNSFIDDQEKSVDALLENLPADLDVMFGCFEKRSESGGKKLYNSAVVASKNRIVFKAHKQLLPSYDVFSETRYFERGQVPNLYEIKGKYFGVTVCEDVWSEEVKTYDTDPVDLIAGVAKREGKTLSGIINISASPFQIGKENIRKDIFKAICNRYKVPFLYCNQLGGQDSLIFDGRSLVMNSRGEVTAQAEGFKEDMILVDTNSWYGDMHAPVEISEHKAIFDGLVMGVRDYLTKCNFSSAVLGLSGGIDSALTAAIGVEALGAENVLGVALPSRYSSEASLEDAQSLANNLGCDFKLIPIDPLFKSFRTSLEPVFPGEEGSLTEQNLQARIRGNLLMALSNTFGHLLLTTGNKSEMAVGYCTLYGDMCGGLAVISDLPKELVYEMAHYVNRNREIIPDGIITKAPSAELKPDQKDEDELPPYKVLDLILELHLEKNMGFEEIVSKGYEKAMVKDILHRVRVNEYKRKQAPLGLKVTSKAFGNGRRYPNVQNYQG